MGLRIVTWNVNGIRNPFSYEPWRSKRSFESMFDILEADIVIFQETKIQRKDLRDDMVLIPGWDCYFSFPAKEKGKFGVVIYTRQATCAPIRAEEGLTGTLRSPNSSLPFCELPEDQQIGGYPTALQMVNAPGAPTIAADFDTLDCEGRAVLLEFPAFVLFGVYAPAARDDTRVAYRAGFFNLLDARIRNLIKLGKRVVLTGDLNVSKEALDNANIEAELRKSGTTVEEHFNTASRRMFNHLVVGGSVLGERDEGREEPVLWDVCRGFHPTRKGMYTHWDTVKNARPGNFGSRIDYILCSTDMKDWFSHSDIQEGLHGSDHCPVFAVMKDRLEIDGKLVSTQDMMNPAGMFVDGKRKREYSQKDGLPISGRLIPDFTGRQSIRDMFAKRPSLKQASMHSQTSTSKDGEPEASPNELSARQMLGQVSAASTETGRPAASNTERKAAQPASKRPLRTDGSSATQTKKAKSSATSPATKPSKNQRPIASFFKPKAAGAPPAKPFPETSPSGQSALSTPISPPKPTTQPISNTSEHDREVQPDSENKTHPVLDSPASSASTAGELKTRPPVEDPARDLQESKEGWARLFSKPQIPLCEHGEPCKQMLSKKQGVNYMRWFYMCARPLGPSGDKERGTQWRCRTFIWHSQSNMST